MRSGTGALWHRSTLRRSSTRVKSREVAPVDNACVERVMDPNLLVDIVEKLNVWSLEAILPQQIQGRIREAIGMEWVDQSFELVDDVSKLFRLRQALRGLMRRMFKEVHPLKGRFKYPLGYRIKKFGSRISQLKRLLDLEDHLKYMCRHRQFLNTVCSGDQARAKEIATLLNAPESEFWTRMHATWNLFRPLMTFQKKYDCTSVLACEIVRDWDLVIEETARANDNSDNNKIPDDCLQSFCAILRARKAKHASVSVRVAHFLDPRVMQHRRSNEITAFKRNDLEDVARKMYPQSAVLIEICSVLDNSAGRERVGRMQPAKWAALYANGTEYPALHPILEVFLRAKGSQSVAERGWSAVDFVCGPRRKRLCPDRQQFLMDGFWWFGYIKPSKQCDLLSFH